MTKWPWPKPMKALWAKSNVTLLYNASSWSCYGCNSHFCDINLRPLLHRTQGTGCGHHDGFSCNYWCWQAYSGGDIEIIWKKNLRRRVALFGGFSVELFIFFINLWSNEQVRLPKLVCKDIFSRRSCAVVLSEPSSSLTWLLHNPFNPSSWLKLFRRFIWPGIHVVYINCCRSRGCNWFSNYSGLF